MESSHGILNFSLILSIGCSLFFLAQFFEDIRIGLIFSLSILIMGPWYILLSCWTLNPTWKWNITPVLWFAEFDYCLFILWIYYKKIAISFMLSIRFVFWLIFLMICKLLDLVICFGVCLSCLLGFAIAIVDSNLWPSVAYYYLLKPPAWLVGILSTYCCFWTYFVPSFEERQFLC